MLPGPGKVSLTSGDDVLTQEADGISIIDRATGACLRHAQQVARRGAETGVVGSQTCRSVFLVFFFLHSTGGSFDRHADTDTAYCLRVELTVVRTAGLTLIEHMPKYIQIAMRLMYGNMIGSRATQSGIVVKLLQHMSAQQGKTMDSPASTKKIQVR